MIYIKKITRIIKRMITGDFSYFYNLSYQRYIKKININDNNILIEPQQGRTINGSMFYIIKELTRNDEYSEYKVYVVLKKDSISSAMKILAYNKIENVEIVQYLSKGYYKLLASSKYLITDTSFPTCFVKRDGQVVLNTWHGTPLKCLGKKSKSDYHNIGNVQKNFLVSDFLLYPNQYTKEHLIEDYMLENICDAKVILAGYPRNTAFFDNNSRNIIRKELNLENKEILVYMPTWRECKTKEEIETNAETITTQLIQLESELKENQILYVNLHPLDRKAINFELFDKIKQFPENYETYQFLNIVDCLITDYSSVFFDFAITKRKIILFTYDEEKYLGTRGLYFDFNELPFTKTHTVTELVNAINTPKGYSEEKFIEKYCSYDDAEITKKICEAVILNNKNDLKIEKIKNNKKENILLYVGNLAKNGITSSVRNLLSNIDTSEKNYYLTFSTNKIANNKEQLLTFPKGVNYIATTGKTNMSIPQKIKFILFKNNLISINRFKNTINEVYKNEIKRLYGNIKFNSVIQFCGYEYKKILFYSVFDCNTAIYVHSDMENEIKTRQIQHNRTLQYAYNAYKKVVVVNKDLVEVTANISKKTDNIFVANNLINYQDVIENSKVQEIEFDEDTQANITLEKLKEILEDKSKKKFITIGRFSPEKGHDRLIRAFNKLYKENNDIYLIIIGGVGKKYDETLELIDKLEAKENIIAIKSVSNPYVILKKCDYFVLSSYYEGFGIVIAEADILGKPVISTDIIGPREFMKQNGGTLVENNEQGLYDGMKKMLNNEVKCMNVDYKKYNENAIKEFYKIINE